MPAKKKTKAKEAPKKPGRPTKYTPALVTAICERLSKGEPLACICRDDGMPHRSTVDDWKNEKGADGKLTERAEFVSRQIACAREDGFDALAREALEISDDGTRDYAPDGDGGVVVNHDHIQRSRLRVDTRLKLLAKWDPKRYGDKVQLADSDGEKLPPAQQPVTLIKLVGVGNDGS